MAEWAAPGVAHDYGSKRTETDVNGCAGLCTNRTKPN